MKNIILILAILYVRTSEADQSTKKPTFLLLNLSAGGNYTCALDDEGVKCWGWNQNNQINVPQLKNPVQVSAKGGRAGLKIHNKRRYAGNRVQSFSAGV